MSKIAREILNALTALDFTKSSEQVIDSVLAGKTITRREVNDLYKANVELAQKNAAQSTMICELHDQLKRSDDARDYWQKAAFKEIDVSSAALNKNQSLSEKLWAAEEELNKYRQAEAVEAKLDAFAGQGLSRLDVPENMREFQKIEEYNRGFKDGLGSAKAQAEVNRKVDEYNALACPSASSMVNSITWTWRGEPSWTCPVTEQGKESNTPSAAKVFEDTQNVEETPAQLSYWQRFKNFLEPGW